MSKTAQERYFSLLSLAQSGDFAAANEALRKALLATPKDPNLLHLAAQVAGSLKETDRAIVLYRRAAVAYPHWFEATMNLARILSLQNKNDEALAALKDLAPHHPQRPEIPEAQAKLSQRTENLPHAIAFWQKALALRPDNPEGRGQYLFCCRQVCDWREAPAPDSSLSPNITAILFDDPALQRAAAERYCAKHFNRLMPLPPPPPYAHKKLRVGYLSSDFHAHATSWLIAELFSLHDRERFEIYAYSYGIEDHSAIRERLRHEADHFIELNALTPLQCAERIRADEIDILIDLKGHTSGARLDILAHRPAPRQMHWLGFPATTGAPFIDAFVADSVTVPSGSERYFTETVLRLPHTYQINDRQKKASEPLSKSAYGLPDKALVLASFNQTYKITPEIFSVWCEVLQSVPDSVLWLLESNPFAPDALRQEATKHGVDPTRLHFAPAAAQEDHLARYGVVDLALDTFPVGGHTTTSDALWSGVPVVTMAGQSFVSRVAASLLTAAELPQLITTNLADYKALALRLSTDHAERKALHNHLTQKRLSLPLFDTPRFVKDFEAMLIAGH
ncbi:MAG: tetratricopeptide repeat protein [Bdellovibrionales bacterium]|jgi:predicted O-linked N-acetylglucosamine transferase (SPINDLY family)